MPTGCRGGPVCAKPKPGAPRATNKVIADRKTLFAGPDLSCVERTEKVWLLVAFIFAKLMSCTQSVNWQIFGTVVLVTFPF